MPESEVARIRSIYAKRSQDLYSPTRPDVIANVASVRTAWGKAIEDYGLKLGRVLEVGCGHGSNLRWLREAGATLTIGIDVLPDRLRAGRTMNPTVNYVAGDARLLPFPDRSIDTVVCSTLFRSVLADEDQVRLATEISRVLRRPGDLLWFDFFRDNPRNPDVRGMSKARIGNLFDRKPALARIVLAPPLARLPVVMKHAGLRVLLEAIPLLRTHYAGIVHFD